MRGPRSTEGAAMILVVLFTLLLLAGILAATLRLGLGSRQNTADQAATLRAQYAAESGLALAQSRLRDIQTMLSKPSVDEPGIGLKLARTIRPSALTAWAEALCGSATWQTINEGKDGGRGYLDATPKPNDAEKSYSDARACIPNNLNSDDSFILFAKLVTPASYDLLPSRERPDGNEIARKTFWRNVFSPQTLSLTALGATATTKLSIKRILRLRVNPPYYRIFMQVPQLTVIASGVNSTTAQRVLDARSDKDGEWWFDVAQPSLLDAVVQTDYHKTISNIVVNFSSDTRFQGPIKTNDVFTFTTSSNAPRFSGKISSSGCTNRIETFEEITCTRNPGVRVGSTVFRNFTGTDAQKSTQIQQEIYRRGIRATYGETPDFASEYQPFPEIAEIQENAANGLDEENKPLLDGSRGIILAPNEEGVELFVGDSVAASSAGSAPNPNLSYDSTNRRWRETGSIYQYLRPITDKSCTEQIGGRCTYTYSSTIYRVSADRTIEQRNGNGPWTKLSYPFNGVIFKPGSGSTPLTVTGPGRATTGATAEARAQPAVASFMGLTIATARQIDIRSDLALSESACRYDEYESVSVSPSCKDRTNVLGLFSSANKILVKKQVPDNAVIQAAVMSSQQEVAVEEYDSGRWRGDLIFTGSMVEKYYGANNVIGSSGYGRDYSHDKRFLDGLTPPFYPTSPRWNLEDASRDGHDLTNVLWKQGS